VVVALARAFNGLSDKPVWIGGFGLIGLATLIILFVYEARR
jgi:hypothetical protein